jgi:hypothetical protein
VAIPSNAKSLSPISFYWLFTPGSINGQGFFEGNDVSGAYRYAHVMFELSFYLTKLVLIAPFHHFHSSTPYHHKPKNGHGDRGGYPFSSTLLLPYRTYISTITLLLPSLPIPTAKGQERGTSRARDGRGGYVISSNIPFRSTVLLTTITGIPSATSYSNEDTASKVVPSSSCCFFLLTGQEGFIDYPSSSSYAAFPCNEEV